MLTTQGGGDLYTLFTTVVLDNNNNIMNEMNIVIKIIMSDMLIIN